MTMKPKIFFAGRWYRCIGFATASGLQIGLEVDEKTGKALCVREWEETDKHRSKIISGSVQFAEHGEDALLRMFASLILS